MVILDNHSSDAMWCCNSFDGNGLWYTDKWSEADWLRAWDVVAQRYASTPAVIGMGLRNEIRPAPIGERTRPLCGAGCRQGPLVCVAAAGRLLLSSPRRAAGGRRPVNGGSCSTNTPPLPAAGGSMHLPLWGAGGPSLDLAVALEKAAAAVLSRSRTKLVFAGGLSGAKDLVAARWRPLTLRAGWPDGPLVDGQLVYEAHEVGPLRLFVVTLRSLLTAALRATTLGVGAMPCPATVLKPSPYRPCPFLYRPQYFFYYGPLYHTLPYGPLQMGLDTLWGWVVQTNTAPLFLGAFGRMQEGSITAGRPPCACTGQKQPAMAIVCFNNTNP